MSQYFTEIFKRLRTEKGLSQQAPAEKMYVTKAAVSRWESGIRLPDATMISRLSGILDVDVNVLLYAAAESDECPNVISADDRKPILTGGALFDRSFRRGRERHAVEQHGKDNTDD